MQELEAAKTAAETNAFAERDRFKEEHQLELAELRADLHQKQLVLDERQSTILTLERELSTGMHRLESQLAEQQTLLEHGSQELREKDLQLSALREELAQSEFSRKQTEMLAATQAEQIRERVKKEIGVLDTQLKEKENALKVMAEGGRELESALNAKIADLQKQLTEEQSRMERKNRELTDLQSQTNGLLIQIHDLERSNANTLEQQRAAASLVEQELHLQVTELQGQLAEKLTLLGSRHDDIQALESRITDLVKGIGQAEVALKQAEATAASEIDQIRRQSQAELAARQAETDRKAEALQQREAALNSAEQDRQLEINGLRAEVAEKHSLLQDRNDELLRVKAELDTFQERIAHLEAAVKQAELESQQKAEQAGESTRIELDKLWNELIQKEQALEERQVAVNDLQQNFQTQIDSLRSELAEKQALLENPSKGFLLGEATLTEAQKEKLNQLEQLVETIKADNEQTLISSRNRRWHFSLGRKRRWKS
jgi:chromosome segregation ATPase